MIQIKEEHMPNIHYLENQYLTVAVADAGAELTSIYDKKNQREIIWEADSKYWKRHAPVLFPNVGKHYLNHYLYNGTTYETKQHGFARDMEFVCNNDTTDRVTHQLKANADTRKVYPFDFVLEITHRLDENQVIVQWKVTNAGKEAMYFTIGGHPAFKVPILENTKQTDYQLIFDKKEALAYILVDKETGTAIDDTVYHLELNQSKYAITAHMFDKDALIFDKGQIQWAAIGYPDGSPYVAIECNGFPDFGIWSVPGAPFVCLEPWDGRCDNKGFEAEISKKPGINTLASGAIYHKEYKIIVY